MRCNAAYPSTRAATFVTCPQPDEQIEDFKKVTLEDVRKFYQEFYGISEGEFAVSGQFEPQEIQKLAAELFGNWKAPLLYKRALTPYRKVESANLKIVNSR